MFPKNTNKAAEESNSPAPENVNPSTNSIDASSQNKKESTHKDQYVLVLYFFISSDIQKVNEIRSKIILAKDSEEEL